MEWINKSNKCGHLIYFIREEIFLSRSHSSSLPSSQSRRRSLNQPLTTPNQKRSNLYHFPPIPIWPSMVVGRQQRRPGKEELVATLRKSWYHLRLSVRHPARVPTWDAVVLTAASPEQAALYDWQLQRSRRMGRIAEGTVAIAVPDPGGARIGSGAATLNALVALAEHYAGRGGLTSQVGLVVELLPGMD